ncbi:MAG: nucleotidyltransferase family protein [Anaerolineae bacterium]
MLNYKAMHPGEPHQPSDRLNAILPEEAWLLLWVRPPGSRAGATVLAAAAKRVRSWRRVLVVADENHITPLLASNLRGVSRDEVGLPAWFVQELDQRRYACLARRAQVAFHLAPLLEALHQGRVPTMLLKGALLAETVYADPGARSFFDVDLLVAPEDVPTAHQVLERRGYAAVRPVDFSCPPRTGPYLNSVLYGGRAPGLPLLHLHWHLVNGSSPSDDYVFRIRMAELWAEAQNTHLWDAPVLAPEPHHMLIQQAEHAYREGFSKLSLLVDVAWVAQANRSHAFWERTLQVAQDWGLGTPCYSSLFLCSGLGLVGVPPHVLTRLRPAEPQRLAARILRRTLERPRTQPWGKLLYLANRQGLAGKVRFAFRALCPPLAELEAIYGLAPGSLTVCGYLRWVAHRLVVAARKGWAATVRLCRPGTPAGKGVSTE